MQKDILRNVVNGFRYIVLFGLIALLFSSCGKKELSIETVGEQTEETASSEKSEEAAETVSEEKICVYICGAVITEGVYELEADSRIQDVLDMAGGYSEDAAHGYINLAEKLIDGEKIYVPTQEELESESIPQPASGVESDDQVGNGLVSINSAGVDELTTLPGIGEGKAKEIIRYRESNGSFSSIEEIKNVSGIGDATFEKIKDLLTL